MAGGGGSGKTTAVTNVVASLLDQAHLVYDAALSRHDPAQEKIAATLAAGWAVVIIYVYRPFEAAVRGVIHRAVENDERSRSMSWLPIMSTRHGRCFGWRRSTWETNRCRSSL